VLIVETPGGPVGVPVAVCVCDNSVKIDEAQTTHNRPPRLNGEAAGRHGDRYQASGCSGFELIAGGIRKDASGRPQIIMSSMNDGPGVRGSRAHRRLARRAMSRKGADELQGCLVEGRPQGGGAGGTSFISPQLGGGGDLFRRFASKANPASQMNGAYANAKSLRVARPRRDKIVESRDEREISYKDGGHTTSLLNRSSGDRIIRT